MEKEEFIKLCEKELKMKREIFSPNVRFDFDFGFKKKSIDVEAKEFRIIGYASTPTLDRTDEIITEEALKKAAGDLLKKANRVLYLNHNYNRPIGSIVDSKYSAGGLMIEAVISETEPIIRKQIEEGLWTAFSIGGIVRKTEVVKDEKKETEILKITEIELVECSLVGVPANPDALLVDVITKSLGKNKKIDIKVEELEKFEIDKDLVLKPYPNEHACRLKDPGQYDSFARKNCEQKHDDKCIDVIYGIKKNKSEIQSLRYKKDVWDEGAAKTHCKGRGGTFEAASKSEEKQTYECECLDCGHKVTSEKHCADFKCPKCGGTMRRAERPGAGQKEIEKLNGEKEEMKIKGALPYKNLGKSPEGDSWDAGKEVKAADVDDLKLMCAWVDSDNADKKGAYKLPHHKQAGGHPSVWRGVAAAMAALLGARGGVDIPDADRKGVYNHLAKHYKEYDKEVPELKEYNEEELEKLFKDLTEDGGEKMKKKDNEVEEKESKEIEEEETLEEEKAEKETEEKAEEKPEEEVDNKEESEEETEEKSSEEETEEKEEEFNLENSVRGLLDKVDSALESLDIIKEALNVTKKEVDTEDVKDKKDEVDNKEEEELEEKEEKSHKSKRKGIVEDNKNSDEAKLLAKIKDMSLKEIMDDEDIWGQLDKDTQNQLKNAYLKRGLFNKE